MFDRARPIAALSLAATLAGCLCDNSIVGADGTRVCLIDPEDADEAVGIAFDSSPTVMGEYRYDDFGTPSEPIVALATADGADGSSLWQDHGCEAVPMEWGLQGGGTSLEILEESERGIRINLWYRRLEPCVTVCSPGIVCDEDEVGQQLGELDDGWYGAEMVVVTEAVAEESELPGQISIYGERWK
jgi:hypothetical protein